jgi:surfactin synthase thioesterase subunit
MVPVRASGIDLLVLPCAGASATMYLRWRRLVPQWLRIVPVELPGRGSRLGEGFVEDFPELVERLCTELAPEMQRPHALFGHSMGALLVHGMARRQRQRGLRLPQALFVSGSPAPSRRDPDRFVGKDSDEALIADLRKQGGTPEEVFGSSELMRLTLDTLGADYRLCDSFRHQPGEPHAMPVHALAGAQDDIERERIEAWRIEAGGDFTLDWFDGGHFFIRQQEQQVVASVVRALAPQAAVAGHAGAMAGA